MRFTIAFCFHMTSFRKLSVHIHNPSLILTIGEAIRKKRGFAIGGTLVQRAEKIIEKAIDPKQDCMLSSRIFEKAT